MKMRLTVVLWLLGGATLSADDAEMRTLFRFKDAEAARQWQTVNDGVMGGRSEGRFQITDDQTLKFFGNLSLENNGGFASVRTRPASLKLKTGDTLVLRVRGDGREYSFNLYVPRPLIAFSYRAKFKTRKNEWVEVELPLEKFVATSFGRVVPNETLKPAEVNSLGILLSDKQAGPFRMDIGWIKVKSAGSDRQ